LGIVGYFFQLGGILGAKYHLNLDAFGHAFLGATGPTGAVKRSLWSSCDELRGGMDASQYKDYVLVVLFVKYVSDRYAGHPYAPIRIRAGASFADMVTLKGNPEIGDLINKNILRPLAEDNALSDMPDFNDSTKLGDGKEKVERLTNLIAIFENPALDISKNRADGDNLLGDAYEYLMRHFATESGKSKGQFYTPAEVSRVIDQILGIRYASPTNETSVYDPTCGSGSLLLKVFRAMREWCRLRKSVIRRMITA
jgi:type I restriction enzyme M protein